jgi:hypothetical protein
MKIVAIGGGEIGRPNNEGGRYPIEIREINKEIISQITINCYSKKFQNCVLTGFFIYYSSKTKNIYWLDNNKVNKR